MSSKFPSARNAMQKKLTKSLITGALAALTVFGFYFWIRNQPEDDGLAWPLRRVLQFNELLAQSLFSPQKLAPEFSKQDAEMPKVNGKIGLEDDEDEPFRVEDWKLTVQSGLREFELTLQDIQKLQHVEVFTELKCIEGWSKVVHWGGIRLSEFLRHYDLITDDVLANPKHYPHLYVSMSTPDEEYFVGIDMASAVQPQTLLATEMNDAPLTLDHGAPLRLAIPVKYGIKSIKRIGHLKVTNEPPADYWAKQGYDWYAGH